MNLWRSTHFPSLALAILLSLSICSLAFGQGFDHTIPEGPKPWTAVPTDRSQDRFMFAVHSDLTGGERPRVFEVALAQLSLLQPEFLISVGDLIEGGTERDQLVARWREYDRRVESVGFPVIYVSGNQDIPNDTARALWAERYGPLYYHFRYKNVLFLVLNTEDEKAAGEASEMERSLTRKFGALSMDQIEYFEAAIDANRDARHVFLFAHKPVWDHPDGVASRLETALETLPFTAFNGHFHTYSHKESSGRDHIQLATTGGAQKPDTDAARDHVTLVTVTGDNVDIANLALSGIFDKSGRIPLGGDGICFSAARCGAPGFKPWIAGWLLAFLAAGLGVFWAFRFFRA